MIETTPSLYITTNELFHTAPAPLIVPPKVQFISKSTLSTALHDRVPPAGTRPSGFGAILPKHDATRDMRLMETTTHSVYGGRYADSEEKRKECETNILQMQAKPAGKIFRNDEAAGIRTGGSTDERLQLGETDPKSHTFIQRSWLGHAGHQDYVLRAEEYAKGRNNKENTEGLALKGLGQQNQIQRDPQNHQQKFYKRNDTIRRDTGIWNE